MVMTNTYLQYKRDQKLLVYWLIHASNTIIKSFPVETTIPLNTSGEITLSTLVSLSELISRYINPVPSTIFRLFHSVIEARRETHSIFQRIAANDPDPELQKGNISHEFWINGLTKAFNILGGETWLSAKQTTPRPLDENEEEVIFSNKFSGLDLNEEDLNEDEGEEAAEAPIKAPVRAQRKGKKGKGKKGKKGKKPKSRKPAVEESSLDKVPLESYRIIEDQTGLVTDYLLAVYSLMAEWSDLRNCLQKTWYRVAYRGLNSAVAGTISNISLAMFTRSQTKILADFPGHESYETVMKTITRGDPDKAQGMFTVSLTRYSADNSGPAETVMTRDIDIREHLMIYAYEDLLDFITDYQKTRSGKPTKPMLRSLKWDPNLDLRRASKEDRLKWRRAYAINWLYDLVNVFSSIVVQRRNLKGEQIALESVDWSVHGPWHMHRRLFGLNEFAGEITSLAMQKPGTDIRPKILPHLVFQLQSIVDSLCVARGWSANGMLGDSLECPATRYSDFRPRRDIDIFLDRNNERNKGFCLGVSVLLQILERDAMLHGDPDRYKLVSGIIEELRDDFVNWLGETKYMYGLTTIPPSRFSDTDSNGLWEYSPYLCGVGLAEALQLAHRVFMRLWDSYPIITSVIHLHNMLVHKGYLMKPIGIFHSLESIFKEEFFARGQVPHTRFFDAWLAVSQNAARQENAASRREVQRIMLRAKDFHDLLDARLNHRFKTKSLIQLFREAFWVPSRVPDDEIPERSYYAFLRLGSTRQVTDPTTGKKTFENTTLVERIRKSGVDTDDEMLRQLISRLAAASTKEEIPESVLATLPEGYTMHHESELSRSSQSEEGGLGNETFLFFLEQDIKGDVCLGVRPMLGLNYPMVTTLFFMLFDMMQDVLSTSRHPAWLEAYEGPPQLTTNKQASLVLLALKEQDHDLLTVMAEAFEKLRSGYITHMYWDDELEDEDDSDSLLGGLAAAGGLPSGLQGPWGMPDSLRDAIPRGYGGY